MEKPILLLTGASSGIGKSLAQAIAKTQTFQLIICGRRKEKLDELAQELGTIVIEKLVFDVRNEREVCQAIVSLESSVKESLFGLVNNAGNAHGLSSIVDGSVEDWDAMIDGNVKGLLYVTKHIVPYLVKNKRGHIVNISSIAGKTSYANGNVYCASKAAVESLSDSMRIDLNPHGIKVTNIAPGAVQTEFSEIRFKGDKARAEKVYEGYTPLSAADVADVILFALTRPEHVVLADILLLPLAQASPTVWNKK